MEINRVHYVIHPLYNLDFAQKGVFNLVDKLLPIIDAEGKLDDRLVIFLPNDTSHYVDPSSGPHFFELFPPNPNPADEHEQRTSFKEVKQRVWEDYTGLTARLMEAVSNCKYHFVGRPSYGKFVPTGRLIPERVLSDSERRFVSTGRLIPKMIYDVRFEPEFRAFLENGGISLGDGSYNPDGHLILGHGSNPGECVPEYCGKLVKAIKTELGKEVSFGESKETTL